MNAKDFVLISILKTTLDVPSVTLQLFVCWDTEESQDRELKTGVGKGIKAEVSPPKMVVE